MSETANLRSSQIGGFDSASSITSNKDETFRGCPKEASHQKKVIWEVSFNEFSGHSVEAVAKQIHLEYLAMPEHSRPTVIKVNTAGVAVRLLHILSELGLPVEDHKPWQKQG